MIFSLMLFVYAGTYLSIYDKQEFVLQVRMPNRPGKPLNDPRLDLVTPTILKFTKFNMTLEILEVMQEIPKCNWFL